MQKICIVSKIKNKNNSGKQVKNKGKFIIVLTLMMIVFNISYNKASANNTNDFGRYHVYSYNESFRYIKYKNLPQRIHEYYYINNESKILPAYCMNLGLGGAETIDGGYDVDAEKFIDDNVVNSIVLNGYPYKTVNELGVDNESQARYATQFAIWIKLNNLDINQIVPMEDHYLKVVQAIKNIYYNGINSNEIYTNGVSIEEVDNLYNEDKNVTENNNLDKLDESYYSKMYKLEYGDNVLNIDLNVDGIKNYLIVDRNNKKIDNIIGNKEIKLLIPRKDNSGNLNYKINIESRYKEGAVLFGKSSIIGMQDLSLTLEPIKLKNTFISGSINEVKTNLSIVKKDAKDENIVIPNVKFNIYDLDDKFIGSYITDKDGKIYLDVEKDLNIFKNIKLKIQEVEVPYPYIIDKQNSEKVVDLKVGCTTSVEFKNDKIEEKGKIELPKTGF